MRHRPALGLLVSLAIFASLEGAARLLPEAVPPARGIRLDPHPTRLWTLGPAPTEPGLPPGYRLDQIGLRAPLEPGPDTAPLILTTGDSSVFGDGLADGDTLHDQLQADLIARGTPVRVRTVAVPGYSTVQTRVILDELGWDLHPSLLIVGDLWSDSNLDLYRDTDLLRLRRHPMVRAEAALSHLALFRQLRAGLNRLRGRPSARMISWPQLGDRGWRRVPLADYAENLRAILLQAHRRGVGAVVLALCNRVTLRDGPRTDQPWAPYMQVQAELARAAGVTRVDGCQAMRASGRSPDELFNDDLHPSTHGAQALADALTGALAGWPADPMIPEDPGETTLPDDPLDGTQATHPRSVQRDLIDR